MFEGIVRVRKTDMMTGRVVQDFTVHNSITAQGILHLMEGRLFGPELNANPLIHTYSHQDVISPAVWAVSGFIDTCDEVSPPAVTTDAAQLLSTLVVTGRLQPSGVARNITTVGIGYATNPDRPSFAVRLSNPVSQAPDQIIDITYSLIARKTNMVSSDVEGSSVFKVSNNTWDEYLRQLALSVSAADPVTLTDLVFVNAPDNFSVGSNVSGKNSLVENLGTSGANVTTKAELGITGAASTTTYTDETTTLLEQVIAPSEAVGYNFNKSLVRTDSGVNMYVNDIGYTIHTPLVIAQNTFAHPPTGVKPYPSIDEGLSNSVGTAVLSAASYTRMRAPTMVKVHYTASGDIGASKYILSTRATWGFTDNNAGLERAYRLPAMPSRNPTTGAWLKTLSTSAAYNGVSIDKIDNDMVEAFSLIQPKTGFTQVGGAQIDAVCSPTATSLTVISNLGTTVSKINSTTFPTFTATALNNYATIQVGGLTRLFVSCSNTGLWRINEVSAAGQAYVPGVPFVAAVPNVDTTKCYAVASKNTTGDQTIVALFNGGLARSTNGGTVWTVYNGSGTGGTVAFAHTGITDNNWNSVKAIALGPTDLASGRTVVALIQATTVVWVELTGTTATVTGTTTYGANLDSGIFKTQKLNACFPQVGTTIPTTTSWVFSDGISMKRVVYTLGTGPGAIADAPAFLTTNLIKVRHFEPTTAAATVFGMVAYDTTDNDTVVLVDGNFAVLSTVDHQLGRVLTATEQAQLANMSCRPYKHFYMTSSPQFAYFNPFFSRELFSNDTAVNTLHHLSWHDYEYVGNEWTRTAAASLPLTSAGFAALSARPTHTLSQPVSSTTAATGILNDLPTGIEIQFDDNEDDVFNAVTNEFVTSTLSSGIQKDAYTTITHRAASAHLRTANLRGVTLTASTNADFVNRTLNFITRDVESEWFCQQGVLGSSSAADILTRSELTTPGIDQTYSISFRVTSAESTGTFAIGAARADLPAAVGSDTLDDLLPIHIRFTGDTYTVYRDGVSATSALTIAPNALFTIAVNGTAGTFQVSVNGSALGLSTASTIPASLIGERHAIGAYANANQNRYAFDMKTVTWPSASTSGMLKYYKMIHGGSDIGADALAITVESRIENPPTSELVGGTSAVYSPNPRTPLGVAAATNEIALMPKSAMLLVNDVADIGTVTMNVLLYKK